MLPSRSLKGVCVLTFFCASAFAQNSDIPKTITPPADRDFIRREVMIPMRDGLWLRGGELFADYEVFLDSLRKGRHRRDFMGSKAGVFQS